ncbi:MAG: MarR family transcriptional regulator [Pedobacter sp.]|nr:MarR family transcriptional regulator [Pedobacter sp.]
MITTLLRLNNLNDEMMHIQKELNSAVKEVFHQAMINVFLAYNRCNEDVRHAVLPFDITSQQFNVLRILRGQHPKPATINLIKARMLDKMCDASRIVDRLVQKDLVNKNINAYDKRAVDIIISEKGIQLLKKTDKEIDLSAIISASITVEEAEQLNVLLNKITAGKD